MKLLIVLALVGLAVSAPYEFLDGDEQAYNEALQNPRLLAGYADCILDKGPCTSEGKRLKETVPEVVATICSKCTDQEKKYAGKAIVAVRKLVPDQFEALKKKFDPEDKKDVELEEFVKKYGS